MGNGHTISGIPVGWTHLKAGQACSQGDQLAAEWGHDQSATTHNRHAVLIPPHRAKQLTVSFERVGLVGIEDVRGWRLSAVEQRPSVFDEQVVCPPWILGWMRHYWTDLGPIGIKAESMIFCNWLTRFSPSTGNQTNGRSCRLSACQAVMKPGIITRSLLGSSARI